MFGCVQLACSLLVFQTSANADTSPSIASECESTAAEMATSSTFEKIGFPSLLQVATKTTDGIATSKEAARAKTKVTTSDDCSCRVVDRTWHVPASAKTSSDATQFTPCFVEVPPESQAGSPPGWMHGDDVDDLAQNTNLNTIYLLGDSHADRLRPGILKVIKGRQFKLFYGSNCFSGPWPHQAKTLWESLNPGHTQWCQDLRDRMEQHFAQNLKPGDLVFMSNHFAPFKPGFLNGTAFEKWLRSYREELVALYNMISSRGGKMLLFGFNHELTTPGQECVPTLWDPEAPRKCEVRKTEYKREHQPYLEPVMNMYTELAGTKPGIAVFDVFDLFCDDETCGAFIPGTKTLAISDTHHLTVAGSEYLAPNLCDLMRSKSMLPSS